MDFQDLTPSMEAKPLLRLEFEEIAMDCREQSPTIHFLNLVYEAMAR
jgi:hypothetical protein